MDLQIVSRADWGARYEAGFGSRSIPTAEAWLHHSATLSPDLVFTDLNADSVDDDEAKAMRAIEQIGEERFGAGFSYNLAVMPSGRLYVGCGVRRVGAHTSKRNTRALGVVLVGNYETKTVPAPMRATLVDLLREGHREGWIDQPRFDGGHRDVSSTACPGRYAYALIPSINAAAAKPAPAPSPAAPTPAPLDPTKGPSMLIVLEPKGHRQFLCDRDGADHIGMAERGLLIAAGTPYAGATPPQGVKEEDWREARRVFLARRGVTDL